MREGWIETTIGKVAKCAGGSAFPIVHQNSQIGIPFIKVSDMNIRGNEVEIISALNHITSELAKKLKVRVWPKDTVIFPKVGAALLTDKRRILTRDTIFDNNIMGLIACNIIIPRFLFLFMTRIRMSDYVQSGALPSISNGIVQEIEINLPPLQEQKRIVDLISSVDSYIDALQHQADSARKSRNAVLHELLSAGGDGWKTHKLGDLLLVNRGGSPRPIQQFLTSNSDGINWIKIADATASTKYIYETKQKIMVSGVERSRAVKSGDFILSNSMSYGRPYIMRTSGAIHDGWLLLANVGQYFDEDFLYNLLLSDAVQKQFDALSAGSGVQNLNIEVVKKVIVRIPNVIIQRAISKVLNEYDSLDLAMDDTLGKSRLLRSGLLSDLLSGDHEIPASYDKIMGVA
jgi:type I restriction enzyme S subunit